MSRRTTIIKQLKASGDHFLLVDGGNALSGVLQGRLNRFRKTQLLEKAKVIIEAYNHMGYHAMALGAGEIGIGLSQLKNLTKRMEFPFLCANLVEAESGKPVFTPSTVKEVNGVRIGLFGLLMNTLQKRYLERVAPGTAVLEAFETGKRVANKLRNKCDIVVGLCHVNGSTSRKLLSECEAIDVIVDPNASNGNYSIWISEEKYLQWVNGKALLRCDGQGSRLGRFDIYTGEKGKSFIPWNRFQTAYEKKQKGGKLSESEAQVLVESSVRPLGGMEVIPIYPHFAEAPEVKKLIKNFRASTRYKKIDLQKEQNLARGRYLTAKACRECHIENYKRWLRTRHAKAYSTLVKTGDEFRYDCLPCHTLGYGEVFVDAHKAGSYKNVQCESCHGSNPEHGKNPEKHPWPKVKEESCLVCHNPKHLGMPFDFEQMLGKEPCCNISGSKK